MDSDIEEYSRGSRLAHLFAKATGLTALFLLWATPVLHLFVTIPDIRWVVGGQLATLTLTIMFHQGTALLVEGALPDSDLTDREGVPEDPTDILGGDTDE